MTDERRHVKHELKIWPQFFDDVRSGEKSFDVRFGDRGFEVGNILFLRELVKETGEYTGRETVKRIRFILRDFPGLEAGYIVLGLHNL